MIVMRVVQHDDKQGEGGIERALDRVEGRWEKKWEVNVMNAYGHAMRSNARLGFH